MLPYQDDFLKSYQPKHRPVFYVILICCLIIFLGAVVFGVWQVGKETTLQTKKVLQQIGVQGPGFSNLLRAIPTLIYPSRTYLILLQNSSELRPTGGFWGTYGIIKVERGKVVSFKTDNIYNLDRQAEGVLCKKLPWQLEQYLKPKTGCWYLRDANWSPDFPTAGQLAAQFYQEEGGTSGPFDGVLAIDPYFIADLMELSGPIAIDDLVFTKENLLELLQYEAEIGYYERGIPEHERKAIVGRLGALLKERLENLPVQQWPRLLEIVKKNLETKHILLWFAQIPQVMETVNQMNWAGRVQEINAGDDYFFVVDANLASLKTDAVMKRAMNYQVREDGQGGYVAKAMIEYRHQGAFDWKTSRYRTYTRIYAPMGSTLLRGNIIVPGSAKKETLKMEVSEDLGKSYFGVFLKIEPGETKILEIEYQLPAAVAQKIEQGLYNLIVQKQAGTAGHHLTIELNFGKKIKEWEPSGSGQLQGENSLIFTADLETDRFFSIKF